MASSDVVLSAALRNNLLSLQNTQRSIDTVQLRLATGLKINSALDGPQQFFTSKALSNRAGDLGRLLDGINLSIRTLEEADKGVTALSNLIDQAQSIVNSARDELASSGGEARIVGNVDLSATADLVNGTITAGDVLRVITTDNDGNQVAQNIAIADLDTAYSFAARITDTFKDSENGEIIAEVTDGGFFSIRSVDGRTFKLTSTTANALSSADLAVLGIDRYFETETRTGGATALQASTVIAGNTVSSQSLYESAGNLADAGDLIGAGFLDADGGNAITALAGADTFAVTVNINGTLTNSTAVAATLSFQDFVDSINQDTALNPYIEAEFDSLTGQIKITSLSDQVRNFQFIATTAGAETVNLGFGDPSGNLDSITTGAGAEDTVFSFNNSTETLDSLASDYNDLRTQIDQLVEDANFRGVNLLNGDDLITFFNEDNSSSLTTSGDVFTANGLGLTEATFRSSSEIELNASQVRDALTSVRNFGSSLATSLSVVQTRRDFTEETINVLKAGSEDLTVADQNEEGANLLALQTRQQLGVTSLALAAQSQQSVLRLF